MSLTTRLGAVGVLAAVLALGAAPARAEDLQRAKQMFQQGAVFFDLGQYDQAIEAWQRGYQDKQDPGFLYNIAQAYRLAGDPRKAILFYKSFLRNSPKAPNRGEIEERIAALQKQIPDGELPGHSLPPAPSRPPASSTSAPVVTPPAGEAVPPPVVPPPVAGTPDSPAGPPSPPAAVATSVADPFTPIGPERRFDLGLGLGSTFWMSGVAGSVDPSFSFAARFGYTFGGDPAARVRFRLGGLLGYTFLGDIGSKVHFVSVLVDPTLRVRVSAERLFVSASVGIGLLAIGGLESTSALLEKNMAVTVSGTQSMLEVRPGVRVEYRLRPVWSLFAGSSLGYSPKRTYFHASLVRMDVHLGVAFRM